MPLIYNAQAYICQSSSAVISQLWAECLKIKIKVGENNIMACKWEHLKESNYKNNYFPSKLAYFAHFTTSPLTYLWSMHVKYQFTCGKLSFFPPRFLKYERAKGPNGVVQRVSPLRCQFKLFFYVNRNDKRMLISLIKYAFEACGKRGL